MSQRSILACLLLVVVATMSGCELRGTSRAKLRNESGERIIHAEITADYNTVTLTDINNGESRDAVLRVWSDTSYEVRVTFASGRTLNVKEGYLDGADTNDNITVTRDSIKVDVHYGDK